MNRTTEELQARYATRFLITAAAVAGAAVSVELVWLGKTGGHFLLMIGLSIVCIGVGWIGTVDLCRRRKQLQQLLALQERGPYDRREYVPPHEAGRQLGDRDGPNMWA
jgi:hypothetical protein